MSALALLVACSATPGNNEFPPDNAGSSGSGGSNGGKGGSNSGGSSNGGSSNGGSGNGAAGTFAGGSGTAGTSNAGTAGAAGSIQDAPPEADPDSCTGTGPADPIGPLERKCAPPTDDECDGSHDINANIPNGQYGNGFDDDCDGKVDEGCACDPGHGPGTTKTCWLVPASQADPNTGEPVGYCNPNAKGTLTCINQGEGLKFWDGFCKGAQFPYADDSCAAGDFDCDGTPQNPSNADCSCAQVEVTCPTEPVTIAPFPRPDDLTYNKLDPATPFIVDGYNWISNPNVAATTTAWQWTITGGDCDNILPHPTFAVFNGKNTTVGINPIGTQTSGLGSNGQQHGYVVGPNDQAHQIFPAFSLSGDYTVQGEFNLNGQHYVCSIQVQVRAPGLRVELCWDSVGNNDVDLHLGRLQGSSGNHGWCEQGSGDDDCYYADTKPSWGYSQSPDDACVGWGSKGSAPCNNPRLDKDNISCDTLVTNPAGSGTLFGGDFCGPENINLDNPSAGQQFLVAAHAYDISSAKPHLNVYCDGARKLSLGYDPVASPNYPRMFESGNGCTGDFWIGARILWNGGADPCTLEPVPSNQPNSNDGSTAYCVDYHPSSDHVFNPGGIYPTSPGTAPNAICGH